MRGRVHVACLLLALAPSLLSAAPPVELPAEVKGDVGAFVTVRGKTDGAVVRFHPLDAGLNVFPSDLLTDRKATVVSAAKPGRYRLLAYSALKNDPTEPAVVTVVIGDAPPVPPGPNPPGPTPPGPDPKPPAPTGALYFLVVRADGPADPAFTRAMALPEWGTLQQRGHSVKDKTAAAAKADLGVEPPAGTTLPFVATLVVTKTPDGRGSSRVVNYSPLPTTGAAVLALAEAVR